MNQFYESGRIISALIGTVAVINLIALLIQNARQKYKKIEDKKPWYKGVNLGILGGIFGIYATISGVAVSGNAVVSIRDVGPMMAGCMGGPIAGIIAGILAGTHRFVYGMPDYMAGSTIPCALSTLLIGIFCGLVSRKFKEEKKRTRNALLIAVLMECLHLTLAFFYVWIRKDFFVAAMLIKNVALPFIIANSMAFMLLVYLLDKISKFQKIERQEKQIESELNIATSIQKDMLPSIFPYFPGRKEFSIDASMNPAKEIGGDFYDFFFVDENHFAFLIADVSGKGVPAALFMVISKTILKNNIQSCATLTEAISKSNKQLCEGNESAMFVTAWVGVLEITSGKLSYVNAGHNPPVIRNNHGDIKFIRNLSGLVLAGNKKVVYKEFTRYLSDGDEILLYTDGVTEAMNIKEEQYGEKRLLDYLQVADNTIEPGEFIESLYDNIKDFTLDAVQSDDITMLAIKISGDYETLKVDSKISNFENVSDFINKKLEEKNISKKIINKVDIALDELFSNVVYYSESKEFVVGVSVTENRISLRMEYEGVEFDITQDRKVDVNLDAKERTPGGLGLFIVKNIMDVVNYTYEDGKSYITLYKKSEFN